MNNLINKLPNRAIRRLTIVIVGAAWLAGCQSPTEPGARGTLEYPRIDLRADSAETLIELHVQEGQSVKAGQLIAELDGRRADATLHGAEAAVSYAEQRLQEVLNGARSETIRVARAERDSARTQRAEAKRERDRARELAAKKLLPVAESDRSQAGFEQAEASLRAAQARLDELLAGTRDEQLRQAQAQLASAQAEAELKQLNRERLRLVASVDGRIDSLPFERGERVPAGAVVAAQLVGNTPYARIFMPMSERQSAQPGDRYQVFVRGNDRVWQGRLRSVSSEPAFTPYFALSGDDSDRLVYLAEIDLIEADAGQLPPGLPLRVLPQPKTEVATAP